jgi:release factor glutamine methyltransferase
VQLKQLLAVAIGELTTSDVPSSRLNAELLLMFVLNCDRAYLFAHPEREINSDEKLQYDRLLADRSRGVPAQYITGHQEFWGMDLLVTPAVLIPRPETEHLIEAALEIFRSDFAAKSPIRIVDAGTGSGCIALALAKELPHAEIVATDISATALDVARANAARHQLENRIAFQQGDLLAGLAAPFDLIVSNPPYVGESEEDSVQMEVRKFEPRNAVFAGPIGTEVIARLIPQAHSVLTQGGWLMMEISGTIASQVVAMLEGWNNVQVRNDLQGIARVVQARRHEK